MSLLTGQLGISPGSNEHNRAQTFTFVGVNGVVGEVDDIILAIRTLFDVTAGFEHNGLFDLVKLGEG